MTTVLGSTDVVEQLSFSMFLSILTLDFDLVLGSFLTFWSPNGLFLGLGKGSKTVWGLLMQLNNFHILCYLQF